MRLRPRQQGLLAAVAALAVLGVAVALSTGVLGLESRDDESAQLERDGNAPAGDDAQPGTAAQTVELTVDYGDGVRKIFVWDWQPELTVLAAIERADANPHGLDFKHKGSGATAVLTQIDDLKNEGGGADSRNWLFRVNGTLADRSFGIYELAPGDHVEWKFDVFRPENN